MSNFSFLQSASHPEELVQQAHDLGYRGMAITDECSLAGMVKAHVAAKSLRFPLLIGSFFRLEDGAHLVVLVTNKISYSSLCQLITLCRSQMPKGQYHCKTEYLENVHPDCCLIWLPNLDLPLSPTARHLIRTKTQRLWIGLTLHQDGYDTARSTMIAQLHQLTTLPMVACNQIRQHAHDRQPLLDTLTAIELRKPVSECGFKLHIGRGHTLRPLDEIHGLYPEALIAETQSIQQHCHFNPGTLRYSYPREIVPEGLTPTAYLQHLVTLGLKKRYPVKVSNKVNALIEKELNLIHKLGYEAYFLTIYDIVSFARSRKILCQGRGSAANSAVCFALGITEVDPEHFNLLFERFISEARQEPPDIDVDFEHERRAEVFAFIYKKYGRHRAALVATVITYRLKSAIRDVGKALGLDTAVIEQVTQSMAWWDKRQELTARFNAAGLPPHTPIARLWLMLVEQILGFPRHLSQHVGGFIIARDQLSELVPIENTAMPERTVIQWDKEDVEALNLLKVDILSLGMLTAIRKAFDLIETHTNRHLTLSSIPPEDPKVYGLLQRADTIGIFQVESRAQMAMLPRLKPRTFYDLAIEVALVRPGPIQGNMVHPYLKRRQGKAPVTYPGPAVRKVLERTLGVPLFQEQVLELAMVAADFSGGEADALRRAMGNWRKRGQLIQYQNQLAEGLTRNGYSAAFAKQIIDQIKGFGEYGFPESHAISFALLTYASAWLKQHYPAAFYCALLNSQPMGFYTPSQLVQDAQRHQITVRPPNVNHSQWDHTLDPLKPHSNDRQSGKQGDYAIRLGLRLIKGLTQRDAEKISFTRQQHGNYQSIDHLFSAADLKKTTLTLLAKADALQGLSQNRHQAHWHCAGLEPWRPLLPSSTNEAHEVILPAPELMSEVSTDYQSLGLTLRQHPMALLRQYARTNSLFQDPAIGMPVIWQNHHALLLIPTGTEVFTAGLITCRQRPSTANGIVFLTLEDETGNTNVIVRPKVLEKYRATLLNSRVMGIVGRIEKSGIVLHLLAERLIPLDQALDQLTFKSRDFH